MRFGFLVFVFAAVYLLVPAIVKADNARWLTITSFEPTGASANGKLTAYEFDLESDNVGSYTVDFILDTASGRHYRIKVPTITPQRNHDVRTVDFAFDDQLVSALRLDPLTTGNDVQRAACSGIRKTLDPESDTFNEGIYPDPTHSVTPPPVIQAVLLPAASTIVDADFMRKAVPSYPQLAVEHSIDGVVVVLITVGPDGKLLDAQVTRTSLYPALDEAALAAAKASTYRAPLINGKPTTRQYKIQYVFTLEGMPPLPTSSGCAAELYSASLIGHSRAFNYDVYTVSAHVDSSNVRADFGLDFGQADPYITQ